VDKYFISGKGVVVGGKLASLVGEMLQLTVMNQGWDGSATGAHLADNQASSRIGKRLLGVVTHAKNWQLLVIMLIFALLSTLFLRLNNLNMMTLRDNLLAADKTDNLTSVRSAAADLQRYTANHMNTTTGQIPLQTLYNRAAEAALNRVRPVQIDTAAYNRAQQSCMSQLSDYGYKAWASCVADTVGLSGATSLDQGQASLPDPSAYYVDFASVRWSCDPAGITLFIDVVLGIIIISRTIGTVILMIIVRLRARELRF
jgi:hypothetical protein